MGAVFETWQRREGSGALSHDSLYFGFVHLITPFNIFLDIHFITNLFYFIFFLFVSFNFPSWNCLGARARPPR